MGVDLITIARHDLDVSSVETAAREVSERFDINVAVGEWDDGVFHPRLAFERHPGLPFFRMCDWSEGDEPVCYDVDEPEESAGACGGPFEFLSISQESVKVFLRECNWRFPDYWRPFGDVDNKGNLEAINRFRRAAKRCLRKLGADFAYCYADQGPTDMIGGYEDGPWNEFEAYIRSGKFLEDYPYECFETPYDAKDVVIFNVSEFLLGHAVEPSHKWCDVFYDDFADLKD